MNDSGEARAMAADALDWLLRRPWPFWGVLAVLALATVRSCGGSSEPAGPGPVPEAPPPPALDAAQRADCGKAITTASKVGLIKGRPRPERIDVDDRLWAELPAELKRKTLAAVSCEVLGRWVPATFDEGPIVAYGWRSGKRVAMLTMVGFSLD